MSNKQPFYHRMEILFTATQDVSKAANGPEFMKKLEVFLRRNLSTVVKGSVDYDTPVNAEPGDPSDLM